MDCRMKIVVNLSKKLTNLAVCIVLLSAASVQRISAQQVNEVKNPTEALLLNTEKRLPGTGFIWDDEDLPDLRKLSSSGEPIVYSLTRKSSHPFTGLAIGWEVEGFLAAPDQFSLEIRSREQGGDWKNWVHTHGYLHPDDSPSGLYWSMLYVTPDGRADQEFEVKITVPNRSLLSHIRITAADARSGMSSNGFKNKRALPARDGVPEILGREAWWGNLPAEELEPDYTPKQISITHAAVHHTVTANRPPDPPQVMRQIWDWHVNDNGWLDIGYNFLIDHEGTIYQGRYNPWLANTDVRGAHAGNANSQSTGLALLGQFEPGASPDVGDPASLALDALVKMISWRFGQNDINPMGSAVIPVNPGGTRNLPTIFGHRDVSATACPGDNLYTLLPGIWTEVEIGEPVVEIAPFELKQNFPNPFRESTTIPFALEEEQLVEIVLYSVRGREVSSLFLGELDEGEHDIPFSPGDLSSGVYFYEIIAGEFRQMMQMVYIK